MKAAIAYTGVSTAQQGRSGLRLEARQAALARFAEAEDFQSVESKRWKLTRGPMRWIAGCSSLPRSRLQHRAPIIVAKLDRLSRDVHFVSGLMSHKTPVIVAELGSDAGKNAQGVKLDA